MPTLVIPKPVENDGTSNGGTSSAAFFFAIINRILYDKHLNPLGAAEAMTAHEPTGKNHGTDALAAIGGPGISGACVLDQARQI